VSHLPLVVGIDFDNTIVCYDDVFSRAALDEGLIPPGFPGGKGSVRDFLREGGREDDWTRLQGRVYGVEIREAPVFPGALEFAASCHARGVDVRIISHKTRHPVLGEPHDLHQAAQAWLEARGFYDGARTGLSRARVHFELTKGAKLARIGQSGCTHFVDDLPEFLLEPGFPAGVQRILFDPGADHPVPTGLQRARSWSEVGQLVLGERTVTR
jgi:hypothetical protein